MVQHLDAYIHNLTPRLDISPSNISYLQIYLSYFIRKLFDKISIYLTCKYIMFNPRQGDLLFYNIIEKKKICLIFFYNFISCKLYNIIF